VVLQAHLRGRFASLSDGLRIGIEAHHLTLWKCLGYCHCNTADAAAGIENAASILQSLDDLRELCEPIAAEAPLVLTTVDHIERNDAFRPELLEPNATSCAECIYDLRRDAEQYRGKIEQSAHKMVGAAFAMLTLIKNL
jgi:hypothetical protein